MSGTDGVAVGVFGASGQVGSVMRALLVERRFPVMTMRYFASADPTQRTSMALARFQGLAFGPVSRTVRTLIASDHLPLVATLDLSI